MPSLARLSLRRVLPIVGALLLATLSCGREITGPGEGIRLMRGFSFEARFGPEGMADGVASDLVAYNRVRVLLVDSRGALSVNRVIPFPSTDSVVAVSIDVPLASSTPSTGETMQLSLAYITPAGDTVFRGGPLDVQVVPSDAGSQPPPVPVIPVAYVGPGASATRVVIAPRADTVVSGDAFAFAAAAQDAGGQTIAAAPIAWRSLTPLVAAITATPAGAGTTLPSRGEALIVAQLLTGPADTVRLQVLPRAQAITSVSGGAQSAVIGSLLASPVVVRVSATDGQPMQGVTVTFTPSNAGSVGTASVTTDALGLAQTSWTLGSTLGAQTLSVTAVGVATPLTVTATATAPVVTLLHHYPMSVDLTDVVAGFNGSMFGGVTTPDGVLRLNGVGEYVILPAYQVPLTGSWSISLFVRPNVASQGQVYVSQGLAGGPGLLLGATATNTLRVGETWEVTSAAAPAADGLFHHVVLVVDSIAGTSRLYVDGVERASQNAVIPIGAGGDQTRFGRSYSAPLESLNGDLDEVRIYRGAIPAATVTALYNAAVSALDRAVFVSQPSNATAGAVITPAVTVRIEDALGRVRTGFNGAVTMELAPGSGTTLGGTLTVNAVAGVATFANLRVTGAVTGAKLVATASGATSGESVPFDVTVGAQVNAWTSATAGNWSVPTNWSLGRAPEAGDSVSIALDGTYTVTLDVPATVRALTVGGGAGAKTLDVSTQNLAVTSTFAVQTGGEVVLQGGTIAGGPLNNGGLITLNGGAMTAPLVNAGTVLVRGSQDITGNVTTLAGSTIRIQGNGEFGPADLYVAAGFVNNGVIDLTSADAAWDAGLTVQTGIMLNSPSGVMSAGTATGGDRYLTGSFVNQGALNVNAALFLWTEWDQTTAGSANGSGTFGVTGGATLRLLDASMSVAVENGGTVEASGFSALLGGFTTGSGSLLRVGAIGAAGDTTDLNIASDLTNNGIIELTNQRATTAPHAVILRTGGTLTNAVGGTIRTFAGNGGGSRRIASTLTNLGLLDVAPGTAGELFLTSSFSNGGTVKIDIGGATPATQYDRITVSGTAALGVGGTLSVALIGGYNPPIGSVFDVLTSAFMVTGTFTTVTAPPPLLPSPTYPGGAVRLSGRTTLQANQWLNTSGGTWSTASNWSQGRVPTPSDTVLITALGTYTVTLDVDAPVGALIVGGASGAQALAMGSSSLTLFDGMTVGASGVVTAGIGSILGAGTLVNSGSMDVTNRDFLVPVTNSGTMVMRGASEFRAGISTTSGSMLRLLGSAAGGNARLDVATDFTNAGTIELTAIDAGLNVDLVVAFGRTLTNLPTGTIRTLPGTGGARGISGVWDNQGMMEINTFVQMAGNNGGFINSGTLAVAGGQVLLVAGGFAPTFVNSGTITLAPNARFRLESSGAPVAVDLRDGLVDGSLGILDVSTATIRMTAANVRAQLQFNLSATLLDSLVIPAGDTLRLRASYISGPAFRNDGVLLVSGPTQVLAPFSNAAGAQVRLQGSSAGLGNVDLWVANGFTNDGEIRMTSIDASFSSRLQVTAGTLINGPTGTIVSEQGTGGTRTLAAELDNRGTVTLSGSGGLVLNRVDAVHVNTGTINMTTSILRVTQTGTAPSFTNGATGVIAMAANAAWFTNGGLLDLRTGQVGGLGRLYTEGATTVRFSTAAVRSRVNFEPTTVFPDPFTVPGGDSLRVAGGTFAPPTLRNDGTLILESFVTITTAFTMADTSRLLLRGVNSSSDVNASFTFAFTNTGRIDMTSEEFPWNATLRVPNGTFVNGPTGVINALPGVGGTRTLVAQLENQGVINMIAGLTLDRVGAMHLNTGTINLTNGSLSVTQTGTAPSFTNGATGVIALADGRAFTTAGGLLDLRTGRVLGRRGLLTTQGSPTVRFLTSTVEPGVTFSATTVLPDPFTIAGGDTLRIAAGIFAPPSLRNDGTLILDRTQFANTPTVTTAFTMADTALVLVRGSAASGGAVNATFTNGFTNTGRIVLTSTDDVYATILNVSTGSLVNAATGTIDVLQGSGGVRQLLAQLDNAGTINIATGGGLTLGRADAMHVNRGSINVSGGNLTLTQSGTAPSFTNEVGGIVELAASRTMVVNGGLLDLRTGLMQGPAARLLTNGATTVRFTTGAVRPKVTFNVGAIFPDALTVPAGDSLRLIGGTLAPPSLLVQGRLALEGTPTVTSAVTTDSAARIVVRGTGAGGGNVIATFTNGFTVGPNAFLDLTSEDASYAATLNVTSGSLTIAPSAQFTSATGANGLRTIGAQLVNQGAVQINIATTLARADAAHVNAAGATMAVAGGNLTVTQTGTAPSFTNDGTINVAINRTFIGNGGTFNLEGGTMPGTTGTFQTLGSPVVRFQPTNVRSILTFSAGTTVPVAFVIPAGTDTVRVRAGTFAPTSLVNDGPLVLEGATTVNTASFSNGSTGVVTVLGTGPLGNANVQIPQGMTNSGILRLTTIGSGFSVALSFGTSTLTNAAGSTLDLGQGALGTRSVTAGAIDNFGTIAANATGTIAAPISQRSLLTVAASRTLTLTSPLTLFSGSTVNVTTGGTLTASAGCTNQGALSLVNFVCP